MTNPDNIVRVRARNGGRASVYEANAWAQAFSAGLFEGNGVLQNTSADMNVLVGGSATKPDVVLATNPVGYKIALDLVGQRAVAITAPASNSRISAIVAYTNDLSVASTQTNITGSPASCGLIVVNGSTASSPVAPTDAQIRSAITADGAAGSQACYCIIATITVASNTTIINNNLINNNISTISTDIIKDGSITADKIDPNATSLMGIGQLAQGLVYSSSTSFTVDRDGFICGLARCNTGSDGECYFRIGNVYCGGLIHTPSGLVSYIGIGVCFPVKAGQTVNLQITNGSFNGGIYISAR